MYQAIDLHCPDQIIHLGDIMDDAEKIARAYPKLPVCRVPKKQIVLGGASILLAHGHQWGVKQSYDRAIADARAVHADLLLFGHTHKALCQQLEDGLWMMNPGASRSSYGLVLAENGALDCSIHPQE